jgi:hypothetical protein
MRDRLLIFCGLIVFLLLLFYPVWHGMAAKTSTAEPDVNPPAGQKECVAPVAYMRAAHMDLLIRWRDGSVREHRRQYQAFNGKSYNVSLTKTCLGQCHGKREDFCDRCHKYAGVSGPFCWDCHNDAPATRSTTLASVTAGRQP